MHFDKGYSLFLTLVTNTLFDRIEVALKNLYLIMISFTFYGSTTGITR